MKRANIMVVVAFALLVAAGLLYLSLPKNEKLPEYQTPSPEEVVRQYFASWNSKSYPDMYATISDGFKRIEPTAKDMRSFVSYAEAQDITGVNILSIKEATNDGSTASVDYSAEFLLSGGGKSKFDGTFTLKYRQGDIIPGWKLIHPYGQNIDTS